MTGQQVGYIRVSSFDQHPERQLDGMALDQSFIDTASGKDIARPQLAALMTFVRRGDTVVVHSMDRLARNLDDLRRVVQYLTTRGVRVQFLKEHLTFTGDDSPMAQPHAVGDGRFCGIRTRPAPRAPARRHCPGASSAGCTVVARSRSRVRRSPR